MRVDLTSAIRVDMDDIGGMNSLPGSTNVTPGRKASAGRSRPSYSSRASTKDKGLSASKTLNINERIEKMYQGSSSNLHVIHQTSPKKAH